MKKRPLFFALLLLLSRHPAGAQEADPVTAALETLKAKPQDRAALETAIPLMAAPGGRNLIRTGILTLEPFPAAPLVALLTHPALAVRLGALELLEEKSGGDFGYNPWSAPGAPENEAALARWNRWTGDPAAGTHGNLLGDEQRRGYLRDLLGGDADKSARARRMLEADGLGAVGFLETFLTTSPALPAGGRAKVREAQYQIVLSRALGPQAAATARQLAFGSRDQMLAALGTLTRTGLSALPILRDFLQHPDPLVRETAIDAMLAAGGVQALPVVGPVLAEEKDSNVIHGALRRLKEIPGDASSQIAASFLKHEDEDLLVSAIQACLKLAGGAADHSPFNDRPVAAAKGVQAEVNQAIVRALDDPRWRVRTAALEFVAARRIPEARVRAVDLLSDPDEFVRYSAIKAATALRAPGAAEKLKEMFLADPAMVGSVMQGYAALDRVPDGEMLAKLATFPPDARLAAVRAAESDRKLTPVVLGFAGDPDLDVSCAALRFLSSERERVADDAVAAALLAALKSGLPEKRAAVLDQLMLPPVPTEVDPELLKVAGALGKGESTTLDPLYDAFTQAAGGAAAAAPKPNEAATIPGVHGQLFKAVAEVAVSDLPESFRAALCLADVNDPTGLSRLLDRLPALSTAQRAATAEKLYQPSRQEALELLRQLIRDPVPEVRAEAVSSALSNENAPAFLAMVFEELAAPGAKIQPQEVYCYRFESAASQSRSVKVVRTWALGALDQEPGSPAVKVLALIALRGQMPAAIADKVLALATSSPDRWIRRAAWQALGSASPALFARNVATLAADPSPQVRAVLPNVSGRMDSSWMHRFDDVNAVRDNAWSSERAKRRLPAEVKAALIAMAAGEPSPEVRFEATFALLSHGLPIDAEAFAALIPQQPAESSASYRIAMWMSENLAKLGPGLTPVAAAIDASQIKDARFQTVLARIAPPGQQGGEFASFAALAAGAADPASPQQQPQQVDADEETKPAAERKSIKLVFFYNPGCQECEHVRQLLATLKADFPRMQVEEHNLMTPQGTLFSQALCARFNVPSIKQTAAPALFTQAGYLVTDQISPQALGKLLSTTGDLAEEDSWAIVGEPEIVAAEEKVAERFNALTLPVVLGAGLLDGVNPCAFATIIFFLSYLQIARRTPREMLMVGAAFILAVFLAYFLAGLALHRVLAELNSRVAGVRQWLNYGFALLALVAAWLSFRDALKARAGKLEDMTLQLPAFLKDRIRGVIRTGARARRFVIAAFLAGIVISFLELACTGQVYAPIVYHIQQGRLDAVAWLLAYNLAFIVPLVVIFLLAWSGLKSESLIAFQKRHTASVKLALGLLFVVLAAVILLGPKLLGE